MTASTDHTDALCDRIMEMSVEELAAAEGITVDELIAQGSKIKEMVFERLSRRKAHS